MHCPYCNHYHPEGTKFCPQTGKQIVLYPSQNRFDGSEEVNVILKNAGRTPLHVVKAIKEFLGYGLAETKYLVDSAPAYIAKNLPLKDALQLKNALELCYAEIEIQKTISFKSSTVEDIKHGDIVFNGIILGGSYPYEVLSGNVSSWTERCMSFIPINDNSFLLQPLDNVDETLFLSQFVSEHIIKDDFFERIQNNVEWIQINIDNPFLKQIGINSSNEIAINIDVLEQLGYMRIRNFLRNTSNHVYECSFINSKPNTSGRFICIVILDDIVYFINDILKECVSFYGGAKFSITD